MSFLANWNWTWPALALAFLLGIIAARWALARFGFGQKQQVNKEYFKGLNFLLNEEPDKAIEVFIKALEVDSETVELHLALGGLFRRKGQVDRATRIHQNLIARPNLTDDQRMQAIHELANDYYKAGWLDRAENLFLELMDSESYRPLAITGLCQIYQQEKEWLKAIDVLRLHKRADRPAVSKQIAHFYCELAEAAIQAQAYTDARQYLRSVRAENADTARGLLLRGDLSFAEGDYARAREFWQRLTLDYPYLGEIVVAKMIRSYQLSDQPRELKEYLLKVAAVPKDAKAFEQWRQALAECLGEEGSIEHILKSANAEDINSSLAEFIFELLEGKKLSAERWESIFKEMLDSAKSRKIEYTCIGCGFDTKAMYWYCPNCGRWESFR